VGAPTDEESSAWISYADRTSGYNQQSDWSTVFIDRNTGGDNYNFKRVNYLICRPGANQLEYAFEHLDYASTTGNPTGVDTHARVSNNGGASWGGATLVSPGDGNYYFFPNGVCDQNDVAWNWFYWRTPTGNDRDLCVRLYDGSWQSGRTDVWNTGDNIQFPTCWSTDEGTAGNRNYAAVVRDQGTTTFTLWTLYVDGDFSSSSPPPNSNDGWGNTEGPFGTSISDANYNRRPILSMAGTGDGYTWVAYMENSNPYGTPNMDTICSSNGFASISPPNGDQYRITADTYAKGH
jgi:hypothetical protein